MWEGHKRFKSFFADDDLRGNKIEEWGADDSPRREGPQRGSYSGDNHTEKDAQNYNVKKYARTSVGASQNVMEGHVPAWDHFTKGLQEIEALKADPFRDAFKARLSQNKQDYEDAQR